MRHTNISEREIARWRRDTPGVEHVLHLNNAGSALPPRPVVEAVADYLQAESQIGGYEQHATRAEQIEACYTSLGRLVGAGPEEIFLADNATRAWDQIFYGLPLERGDRILTCQSEYSSNVLAYLHRAGLDGIDVRVVPDDQHGQIDLKALARELDHPAVRAVSMSHVPTQGGLVNPAAAVGALCRERDVLFLLDACQSVGQLEIDVNELGCDALTTTGRKYVRGPRGIGFGYVRTDAMRRLPPAMIDVRSATWTGDREFTLAPGARRYETWEKNYGLVAGLGAAVDYALQIGIDRIEHTVTALASYLRTRLAETETYRVTDLGTSQCGIVTFAVDGDAEALMHALRARAINVSAPDAEDARWDLPRRGLRRVIRASVHYYNTHEEIDRFIAALVEETDATRSGGRR